MNKKVKYSYGGVNQDISRSKHPVQYYFEGQHIRLLSTDRQATGGVTNEKGNEVVITLPTVTISQGLKKIYWLGETGPSQFIEYTSTEIDEQIADGSLPLISSTQKIIGTADTRTGIIIFSTDDLGMDCIWEIEDILSDDYTLSLLYVRSLNFSINSPIQGVFNYENDIIQKVYWVDGVNQLRFLNKNHSIENGDIEELIDISSNTINFVGNFDLTQPTLDSITGGGFHTSGMIQYAYNLYRLNSSQTTISPLSEMIALDKGAGLGGGELNEIIGTTPIIQVDDIDPEYTHIRLYAIKYTSYNQIPSINLIADREVSPSGTFIYFDDGATISSLTLAEFLFLGSSPIIPKHIESKDNILFSSNIKERNFDVDLDCRAYSYLESSSTAYILNDVDLITGTAPYPQAIPQVGGSYSVVPADFSVEEKNDSVNPNYDYYRYWINSTTQGGEGKYIKYSISPISDSTYTAEQLADSRLFKSNEIYRIGIQFYNRLGQKSFPKWIADFKAPHGNLKTSKNALRVYLQSEFYVWLNDSSNFETEDDKPIGYKIIRADRTLADRTVLYQGILNPMLFQVKGEDAVDYLQFPANTPLFQDKELKFPSYFMRNFENTMDLYPEIAPFDNIVIVKEVEHLAWLNDWGQNSFREIHAVTIASAKLSQTFEHTKLMQFYSPEVMFDFASIKGGLVLKVNGLALRSFEAFEIKEVYLSNGIEKNGGAFEFFPVRQFIRNNNITSAITTPDSGTRWIGPSGSEETTDQLQFVRHYHGFDFTTKASSLSEFEIYGQPEINTDGVSPKEYNGDGRYKYANTLESFLSDPGDNSDNSAPIYSMNSWGTKSATIMLGTATDSTSSRTGLKELRESVNMLLTGTSGGQGVLSVDVCIPNLNVYLGNIYGGNSYEAKKINNYIEIGDYNPILTSSILIKSPGDTFVGNFNILRVGKTTLDIYDTTVEQVTEIVSFRVETTVDIKNRSDISLFGWDSTWQPSFDEYHQYNRVYSQQPTLVQNTGEGYNFKQVETFDTRILASKVKIPGEDIDNWTDLLVNETMDLDGKYGSVNGLVNFKDKLFTFQDEAIAELSINPRIQVQGSDGIAIELGTGGVLYDYNYLTTSSGSINKWGTIATKKGIYYYDALNKAIGRIPDSTEMFLSDVKGLHTFFNNNYDYNKIKVDNPLLEQGVVFGYDNFNNDVFFTILQDNVDTLQGEEKSFTRVYNELIEEFVDRKTYLPTGYINKGEKLLLLHPDNNKMYEQYIGKYNYYFDEYHPSFIILMVNPESDITCVFDNIQFNSELYINDIDQPDKTLTHIQAWNEYQDSGKIPLIVGRDKNLSRKFREWKAEIPRDGRNRMRNPWIFLKLELNNSFQGKLILHDVIISYTV